MPHTTLGSVTESQLAQAMGSRDAAVDLADELGGQGPQGGAGGAGSAGGQGSQGAQGAAGAQGAQGNVGLTGAQGAQGAAGAQGTQGAAGTAGATGNAGAQGAQGAGGAQGAQGNVGTQGSQGAAGNAGAQGAQGSQGAAGFQGAAGAQGNAGAQGAQGAAGNAGLAGAQGAQGSQGAQGVAGSSKDYYAYRTVGTTPIECWHVAGMMDTTNLSTQAGFANELLAIPYLEIRGGTLDRIGVNVTIAGAGNYRLGIYSSTSTSNPWPNALLLDAGTVDVSTTGVKTITINQVLSANTLYWFAMVGNIQATFTSRPSTSGGYPVLGISSAMGTAIPVEILETFTYAALPATFPTVTTLANNRSILVAVRYSA